MAAPLFLPRRPASLQPQQAPQLDRGNPLAVGLIAGVIPFQRVDFVTGRQYTQGGTYATGAGPAGVGLVTDGTAAYIAAPIPQIVLTQWTIFAVLRPNSPASDARAVSLANSITSTPYVQIGTGPGDAKLVRVLAQNDASGLPANQPSVAFGFDGPTRTIALTYDGSNVRCYIDGVLDTTAPTSAGSAWTVNQFAVGAHVRTSAQAFWRGSTFLAMAHKRALSDGEIKSLTANPWQLFTAPQRILPLAASAGGTTFSYTASGGFTLSGTATTVRSATKTTTGGLQLSGTAATARGTARSASGGFQLSGSAAQARSKVFTASGGISFSGAASVLKGVTRMATGGLSLSGAASVIVTTATQSRIVTAAGGFALSGTAAVIRVCTRATSGGISFAGAAATSFQRAGAVIGGWINMARRRRRE